MNKIENICIFGDSTAWGAWDRNLGGWANRLWIEQSKQEGNDFPSIYNCSISGGTTSTILERFEVEAKARGADVIIFQSGANDSCTQGKGGDSTVPIDAFERNIEDMVERARKITTNILFIGSECVDETKTSPVYWEDIYYSNNDIQKYNDIARKVCIANNVPFLDLFDLLTNDDLEDGIHPNTKGHEKIFEKAKSYLKENAWI